MTKKKGYRDDISVDMFAAGVVGLIYALGKFDFFDQEYFSLVDAFSDLTFKGTPLPEALGGPTAATQRLYDVYERQRKRIELRMETKVAEGKVSEDASRMLQFWISPDQELRRMTLGWETAEMFNRA